MDEKATYVAGKFDVASVVTKPECIKSIAENASKITAAITKTNVDATLVQNFLFDLLEKGLETSSFSILQQRKLLPKTNHKSIYLIQISAFRRRHWICFLLLSTRTQNVLYRMSWSPYLHTWDSFTIIKISPSSIITKKYLSDSEY
jgi:hypothetical protein